MAFYNQQLYERLFSMLIANTIRSFLDGDKLLHELPTTFHNTDDIKAGPDLMAQKQCYFSISIRQKWSFGFCN